MFSNGGLCQAHFLCFREKTLIMLYCTCVASGMILKLVSVRLHEQTVGELSTPLQTHKDTEAQT